MVHQIDVDLMYHFSLVMLHFLDFVCVCVCVFVLYTHTHARARVHILIISVKTLKKVLMKRNYLVRLVANMVCRIAKTRNDCETRK